jgi:hemoglobin
VDREAVNDAASEPRTPYDILGDAGIRDLVGAFYDVMDESPDVARIRAMHAQDLGPMKSVLTAYLTQWMGGPPVYLALRGSMCLSAPHMPFAIGPDERDMWLACMDRALERVGASDSLKAMLREPLRHVAEAVRNRADSARARVKADIIAVG